MLAALLPLSALVPSAALLVQQAAPPVLFDAVHVIDVGQSAGGIRGTADFDLDGDLDLLWMDVLGSETMRVLWNAGPNSYSLGGTTTSLKVYWPLGSTPGTPHISHDPVIADLDGDGLPDVAMAMVGFPYGGVAVFLSDGSGGFSTPYYAKGSTQVFALGAGQADLDPEFEVFVHYADTAEEGQLTWLHWNGASFTLAPPLAIGGPTDPLGAVSAVGADFDQDGDDDVAALSADYKRLRVLLTSGGAFGYGPSQPNSTVFPTLDQALFTGDFEGDGDVDLFQSATAQGSSQLWFQVHENVPTGYIASWPVNELQLGSEDEVRPRFLVDWDGDGLLDVVNQQFGVATLLRAHPDGSLSFGASVSLSSPLSSTNCPPADLDGDGWPELIGSNVVRKGDGSFTAPPAPSSLIDYGNDGQLVAYDLEGDGDPDLVGDEAVNFLNDGNGNLTLAVGPYPDAPPVPGMNSFFSESFAFDDFDGDGYKDHVVEWLTQQLVYPGIISSQGMRFLKGDGKGGFLDGGPATGAQQSFLHINYAPNRRWRAADIDSDGDLDVLVDDGYWRNDGSGYFDGFLPAYTGLAQDAADVDGDGDLDLAATELGSETGWDVEARWIRNDPSGFVTVPIASMSAGNSKPAVRLRDVDLDGDVDVLGSGSLIEHLWIAENVSGAFPGPPLELEGGATHVDWIWTGDLGDDGVGDLVALRSGHVRHWSVTGPGLAAQELGHLSLFPAPAASFRGLVDLDQDGDLDAVGEAFLPGLPVQAPEGGIVRQFGNGIAGAGGFVPILGANGPVTSTSSGSAMHLVRCVGQGTLWFAFGTSEVALPDTPFLGMTFYVGGPSWLGPITLSGTGGAAGEGELHESLPQFAPLAGLSFVHQAFVLDAAAPIGIAASNALEILYGP